MLILLVFYYIKQTGFVGLSFLVLFIGGDITKPMIIGRDYSSEDETLKF